MHLPRKSKAQNILDEKWSRNSKRKWRPDNCSQEEEIHFETGQIEGARQRHLFLLCPFCPGQFQCGFSPGSGAEIHWWLESLLHSKFLPQWINLQILSTHPGNCLFVSVLLTCYNSKVLFQLSNWITDAPMDFLEGDVNTNMLQFQFKGRPFEKKRKTRQYYSEYFSNSFILVSRCINKVTI